MNLHQQTDSSVCYYFSRLQGIPLAPCPLHCHYFNSFSYCGHKVSSGSRQQQLTDHATDTRIGGSQIEEELEVASHLKHANGHGTALLPPCMLSLAGQVLQAAVAALLGDLLAARLTNTLHRLVELDVHAV